MAIDSIDHQQMPPPACLPRSLQTTQCTRITTNNRHRRWRRRCDSWKGSCWRVCPRMPWNAWHQSMHGARPRVSNRALMCVRRHASHGLIETHRLGSDRPQHQHAPRPVQASPTPAPSWCSSCASWSCWPRSRCSQVRSLSLSPLLALAVAHASSQSNRHDAGGGTYSAGTGVSGGKGRRGRGKEGVVLLVGPCGGGKTAIYYRVCVGIGCTWVRFGRTDMHTD